MSEQLQWTTDVPVIAGWYWVKWKKNGKKEMWCFDDSEWDTQHLENNGALFYGPLQPPPEDNE